MDDFKIGHFSIGRGHKPYIIAEMSGNHNQSFDRALEIVEAAAKAGAQAESQFLKLEALLKATGNAAKQTGTDIEAMAREIGIGTLASVQGARDAAGVLLTFKTI